MPSHVGKAVGCLTDKHRPFADSQITFDLRESTSGTLLPVKPTFAKIGTISWRKARLLVLNQLEPMGKSLRVLSRTEGKYFGLPMMGSMWVR